uniref:Uncharacterized protein n=1 Tax=Oryza rufipogon TaxID=4529 RepID=A0A0E0NVB5_ORYRU
MASPPLGAGCPPSPRLSSCSAPPPPASPSSPSASPRASTARSSTPTRSRRTTASRSSPTRSPTRSVPASRTTSSAASAPTPTSPRRTSAGPSRRGAPAAVARVHAAGRLPVVAGGSNIYVEALVAGGGGAFLAAYDCLFLWTDVAPDLLRWYTAARVDDMVRRGLVGEARAGFDAGADYTRGVRRAIGLPEMHGYLLAEREGGAGAEDDDDLLAGMLEAAVREIKDNTFRLTVSQVAKIRRLSALPGWDVRRVDATAVVARMAEGAPHGETWREVVWEPCEEMVSRFLETPAAAAAVVANGKVDVNVGDAAAGVPEAAAAAVVAAGVV